MVIIITLNYNQNEYTLKCVESVLKSFFKDFLILLIDNGSTKKNYKELKKNLPNDKKLILKRIENNIGYVGGINYGLHEASLLDLDYFLIMNNDTIIDENGIKELVKTCKEYSNKVIVSGKVYHYDEPNMLQDVGIKFKNINSFAGKRLGTDEIDRGQFDFIEERDLLDDVFWLFPYSLYKEIGGYSPYFWFSAEQADFALRAKKNGYKLIFTPKAKLWHKGSVSIGGRERNPKLAYWHVQSNLIFRFLYLSKVEFLKHYFKVVLGIGASYYREYKKNRSKKSTNYDYPNAKLKALQYFNVWIFKRNVNTGKNPFD